MRPRDHASHSKLVLQHGELSVRLKGLGRWEDSRPCSSGPRSFPSHRTSEPLKFTVLLARRMMRRRRRVHGLRPARTLRRAMPLLRRHLAPLLAQLLAPLRRHLTESIEGIAYFALPLGRQLFEFLPALPHQLPLLRRHGAPLIESLLGAGALLRRHGQPALAPLGKRLLAFRGQAIPLALIALEHLLLLRRERLPRPWASGRRTGGGWGSGTCWSGRRGRRNLREARGNA